jgi:hypothetical protein
MAKKAQPGEIEQEVDHLLDDLDRTDRPDRDLPVPLTENERDSYGEAFAGMAERGTDGNDSEDRLGEMGGSRPPGRRKPPSPTRQLVQDAGGYSAQADPSTQWVEETVRYCKWCGEWIGPGGERIPCDVPHDPCKLVVIKGRLQNGCQSCREQWALDQRWARRKGRQAQTCRPKPSQERKLTCAYLWQKAKEKARRRGLEPTPHEPNWTPKDWNRLQNRLFNAKIDAENKRRRERERQQWPGLPPLPTSHNLPHGLGTNGTGFPIRRRPYWWLY